MATRQRLWDLTTPQSLALADSVPEKTTAAFDPQPGPHRPDGRVLGFT